jgi:DNA-binding response OmpR family regulator
MSSDTTAPPSPDESLIRVLLVEDDEKLARLTADYLERSGLVVTRVADGRAALATALAQRFDIVVLDLMLPHLGGLEVCRELRTRSSIPVLMVTARDEEVDRVLGLEVGADDYVTKPFSTRELLARIRAHVRRARGRTGPAPVAVLRVGPLTLEPGALRATLRGQPLDLTSHEFALLRVLAERPGQPLSREELLVRLGSADQAFDRAIDVRVSRLRQKLEADPREPQLIKTVRGVGYVLVVGEEA